MKGMMILISGIVLTVLIAIAGVSAQQAKLTGSIRVKSDDEAVLAGMAKIALVSAVDVALKTVPGKAFRAEIGNENGYLVYSVEIAKADSQILDVKVDAGNGKVLRTETDQKDNEGQKEEDSDNGHEGSEM